VVSLVKRKQDKNMYSEFDFFLIEKVNLKEKKTFPFQVYIFNPEQKKFSLILNGNRPLTKEIDEFINFLTERGGKLAILKKQRKTFLNAQSINESEIPSLKNRELHDQEKEQAMYTALKQIFIEKNGAFDFHKAFDKAATSDNFTQVIEYARVEILTFSVCHSPTTSFAIHLAKEYLITDNFINRIVATSYFSAKTMNLNDQSTLADIIVACFLMHIGLTQLPVNYSRTPLLALSQSDKKLLQKHTILANHLVKKGALDISDRCRKIILDHHERASGNGYPSEKLIESIDTLSLLVGAVSHLFEFSSGKINGNSQSLKSVIINMKNKNYIPGLEYDFGNKIFDVIVNVINTDTKEYKKIA
jgi:HD-GYP domain-containing protein (c-di-GMP phosphodiesterase class II)